VRSELGLAIGTFFHPDPPLKKEPHEPNKSKDQDE